MSKLQITKMESRKENQEDWVTIINKLNKKKEKRKASQSKSNERGKDR